MLKCFDKITTLYFWILNGIFHTLDKKKCIYILSKIFVPSFLFEMTLCQNFAYSLAIKWRSPRPFNDHERFLETTWEYSDDYVRKDVTKTFECFKDVKLLHLNLPIFKKILWGEGIDKMSMEKFYDFILVSIFTVLHSNVRIYIILMLKMTEKRDLRQCIPVIPLNGCLNLPPC